LVLPRNRLDIGAALLLAGMAIALFAPVLSMRPLEADNVYALAWVHSAPLGAVFIGDAAILPEWRPLPYATLWVMHHLLGLNGMTVHFIVNLAIWIACAWLVYGLVRDVSGSVAAGLIASLFLLSDTRVTWTLTSIIDRQMSLACLFGLLAWRLVIRSPHPPRRARVAGIALLLIASALSKEYGLAFAVAVLASGLRQRPFAYAALSAIAMYVVLRLSATGFSAGSYCEVQAFFLEARPVCMTTASPQSLSQAAYNVGATLTNFIVQGFFSDHGLLVFARRRVLISVFVLAAVALALARGDRRVRMLVWIPVATAALNFPIYADRNQLAGACAVAILVGAGIAAGGSMVRTAGSRRVAAAVIVALLFLQAADTRRVVADEAADVSNDEPCDTEHFGRVFVREFIAIVKTHYGLDDPQCLNPY
jgi:hypothetical protein